MIPTEKEATGQKVSIMRYIRSYDYIWEWHRTIYLLIPRCRDTFLWKQNHKWVNFTMYENEGRDGSTGSTTFHCLCEHMESWKGAKTLVACSGYNVHTLSKSTKEVCSVQGTWYFTNMAPTMVHRQTFRNITWQRPIERDPITTIRGSAEEICMFQSLEAITRAVHRKNILIILSLDVILWGGISV